MKALSVLSAVPQFRHIHPSAATSTTSYSVQIANSVSQTTVTPIVNHSGASYVIKLGGETDSDGTVSLTVGKNVITVEVTAEDDSATKTYTVNVTRVEPPSIDATLKGLTLSRVDFGTFDSTTTSYSAQVANSVTETNVTPTVNHSGASYVIKFGGETDSDGTISLAVGSNVIKVEVTAGDGQTTKTYTVTVTRAAPPSSDATLKALSLSGINLGTFRAATTSYSVQVANSVSQATVTPTLNDSGASYVIKLGGVTDADGTVSLAVGSNVITVVVTAEDTTTTRTYTVTVTRAAPTTPEQLSSDAALSALTLSGVNFGTFDSTTISYSARVANSVSQTNVTPTVNHTGASYVIKLGGVTDADGSVSLSVGKNVITVKVTAEDDSTTKTYTVTVTRSAPFATDATLSALTLSGVDFGTFASRTTFYTASVANSVSLTNVTPTLNDSDASYVIKLGGVTDSDGTVTLAVGSNVITVEVTAEDDSTKKTYTVTVTRAATSISEPDLAVPFVITLTNLYGYDPSFTLGVNVVNQGSGSSGSTTLRYYRSADSTITSGDTEVGTDAVGGLAASGRSVEGIDLTAPSAPGTYYYGACVDAVPDESDTTNNCSPGIAFVVPAVSSTDATLTALTLSGIDFGTFDSTTVSYSTQVSNSVTQTTVRPTVNDSGASYVIMLDGVTDADGTISLAVGSNVITVVVTAEDGHTTRIYTLRITRDSVSEPETSAGICDRTSEVQEAILGKLNEGLDAPEITDCSEVTDEDLGGIIGSLILSNMDISALKSGDFQGLSGLTSLYLDHNNLTTLPEGIFQGLDSLDILWLHFNPGSPFSLTMELEQQGEDSVLAKVVEGTPFDMVITLSSDGGTLSSTEITVVGGDIESEAVVVTADEGSTEVTVSVASSDIPGTGYTNFFGLVWQEAEPLVITFEAEIVTPELVLGELPTDDPPVNFRITSYDDSQVSLSWEIPNNRGITVYELKRYDHDGTEFASSNWSVSGTVAGGDSVTEFSTGLTADSRYRYDLVLKSDTGTVIIEKSLEVRTRAVGAAALSSDVTLSVLSLSRVELDPVFTSAANSYTGNVASDVAQTTVTATPNDTAAGYIVKLGGAVDADGAVDLTPGRNVITVHVTAEDGVTTRIYTVVVTRAKTADALSSDATLRSLSLSGIDFGTFDPDTTTYTAQVINDVTQTTVTPVRNDVEAAHVIKVGGVEDADGDVSLAVGENVISVEVTAEDGETTRTYTVTVTRDGAAAPDPEPDPTPADTCVQSVGADGTVAGSWGDTCLSEKDAPGGAGDRYARFYTFTLTEVTDIVINLSSDEDTYLYLLNGHGKGGNTLHSNDDIVSGGVNLNSRLSVTLQPGSYTIEATTYKPATSGSFTLTIAGLGQAEVPAPPPQPDPEPEPEADTCIGAINGDGTIEGSWDDSCLSDRAAISGTGDRYARFYTFTLTEAADVTITLESDEDTYLYLLSGHGRSGTVLYDDDDIVYGVNTDSRLSVTLQPGDYTIEATTYYAQTDGNFTLTIAGLGSSQ